MMMKYPFVAAVALCATLYLGLPSPLQAQDTLNNETGELLTLPEAVARAIAINFDVQIAENELEVAETFNNWGNAGRYPNVNGQAGYNLSYNNLDQRLSNGTNFKRSGALFQSQNASINTAWRIYGGGRVLAAKERLDEAQAQADFFRLNEANRVAYEMITAYLDILRFKAQQSATLESMSVMEERRKLAENRWHIGTAGKMDFLQAQNDYNEAAALAIQMESNVAQAKTAVNNLLNRSPFYPFRTSDSLPENPGLMDEDLMVLIDSLNPAMLMAKAQLRILAAQRTEINALRLPSLSVNLGYGLNNSRNAAGFTLRNTTFGPNGGLTLAVPIFQGNVVKQNLRVNEIDQNTQQIRIDQLRNDLQTDYANGLNLYRYAKQRYELELQNLEVARENNFIAMERFRKASITTVELRQVQLLLIDSQTRMINAHYEMKQAEADLLFLLGRLVDQ